MATVAPPKMSRFLHWCAAVTFVLGGLTTLVLLIGLDQVVRSFPAFLTWNNNKPVKVGNSIPELFRIPTTSSYDVENQIPTAPPHDPVLLYPKSSDYFWLLKKHGMESTALHEFQSPYVISPVIYDKDTPVKKAPGQRNTKIISCFNCPPWHRIMDVDGPNGYNKDFKRCPYTECLFDRNGKHLDKADVVMFFPIPHRKPSPRPLGQIWAYCSWESPVHYGMPSPYSEWKDVFNWTINYQQNADLFSPVNRLVWKDRDTLLPDSEYRKVAEKKTKTALWMVSNCPVESKRKPYVMEMKNYIDVDIYGRCGMGRCEENTCLKKLNDTYKFYLSFENSFCRDYVTEKLWRNFDGRLHVVPVVRGAFEYEKYIPPNTFINAKDFKSPKELALYLKDLGNDIDRYSNYLKEKDKLKTLNYKYDWCDICERLHKGVKPKQIADIRTYLKKDSCWH